MQLSGKTVLLTGGTSGIGEQLARQMRAKGATVIVTGRNADRLAAMRSEGFEAMRADLSNAAGVDAFLAEFGAREIDLLVNNAGQGVDHDFRLAAPDADAADGCIYSNLNAPIRLTAALVPRLKQRPEAVIVNVTSGLAIAPRSGGPVYCATKAGLRSYSQAIRAQLKGTSVRVVEALPPVVETPLTAGRGGKKMSANECARQILSAIEQNRDEANVGMVKALQIINSISPALARKVMLRF